MTRIDVEPGTSAAPFSAAGKARTERSLNLILSQDFFDFLLSTNGGVPVKKYFSLGGNEKVVERMLSIVDEYKEDPFGICDIGVVWSQIEGRLDDSLMPFAVLFGGDFLCFSYHDDARPTVVLWDHERSRENAPTLTHVAPSFQAFSTMLHQ